MKFIFLCFFFTLCVPAFASTPVEYVSKMDSSREGNLAKLVLNFAKKNLASACDEVELEQFSIVKLSASSSNEEKKTTTPYNYEANYLVLQKCLYGSTFAGAYIDSNKATVIQGSFHSFYNKNYGPSKMEDLKITVVKEIDVK